jgi:hypothetical protein
MASTIMVTARDQKPEWNLGEAVLWITTRDHDRVSAVWGTSEYEAIAVAFFDRRHLQSWTPTPERRCCSAIVRDRIDSVSHLPGERAGAMQPETNWQDADQGARAECRQGRSVSAASGAPLTWSSENRAAFSTWFISPSFCCGNGR